MGGCGYKIRYIFVKNERGPGVTPFLGNFPRVRGFGCPGSGRAAAGDDLAHVVALVRRGLAGDRARNGPRRVQVAVAVAVAGFGRRDVRRDRHDAAQRGRGTGIHRVFLLLELVRKRLL